MYAAARLGLLGTPGLAPLLCSLRMSREEFEYQREAHAAMRIAVGACGYERLQWVRLALAWLSAGRDRTHEAPSTAVCDSRQ